MPHDKYEKVISYCWYDAQAGTATVLCQLHPPFQTLRIQDSTLLKFDAYCRHTIRVLIKVDNDLQNSGEKRLTYDLVIDATP